MGSLICVVISRPLLVYTPNLRLLIEDTLSYLSVSEETRAVSGGV